MRHERFRPDDPQAWLARAQADLELARQVTPRVLLEDLCYHAQQAAEKAIKAVLVRRGVRFPYTHVITDLLALVEGAGIAVPPEVHAAEILTPFAVVGRYPGDAEPVTPEGYEDALNIAELVLRWAEEMLE